MAERIFARLRLPRSPESHVKPDATEESLSLRIAVQILVAVGIVATDLAAGTLTSVWAVPLSFVGAYWSWRQRRKNSVATKFGIALGILVALLVFFGRLLPNLGDTRLILAELLIHLQVLHSFDLPRRRDLGYSTLIGLILMGVAATLSENLLFGPVLLVFTVASLPTLTLDYRSRLGLSPRAPRSSASVPTGSTSRRAVNWSQLAVLSIAVVSLGLVIFAAFPRLPGYQIRSFPVTAPDGVFLPQFDASNRGVVNPGYQLENEVGEEGSEGAGSGEAGGNGSPVEGPGTLDSTFYYGFGDRINQNLRGEGLTPTPILRVRSQAKGWYRVLAFDRYTGQGWEISRQEPLFEMRRAPFSFRFRLTAQNVPSAPSREVIQTFTLLSTLPNIIPAQATPTDLYFPAAQIGIDLDGNLKATGILLPDLTYTAISKVVFRDREALRSAPADYPETIERYHLEIPPEIAERVRTQAEALLARSEKPLESPYEKALYLAQALKQGYRIKPDLPFLAEGEDLTEAFLFKYGGGYPDHFSTVLTVMLRSIGIPARLATGFGPGQFNPFTGFYIIQNTDAYALTEVYFPDFGWVAFNPIPGYDLLPPSIEDSNAFGVLQQAWSWVAGWLPSPVKGFLAGVWSFLTAKVLGFMVSLWAWFTRSWFGTLALVFCLTLLGFAAWALGRWLQGWGRERRLRQLAPMERLYRQMLNLLATKGYPKHPAQTPHEYADDSRAALEGPIAEAIAEICRAYASWHYGGLPPNLVYLRQQWLALERACERINATESSAKG